MFSSEMVRSMVLQWCLVVICILILPENRKERWKNAFFQNIQKHAVKRWWDIIIFLYSVKCSVRSTMGLSRSFCHFHTELEYLLRWHSKEALEISQKNWNFHFLKKMCLRMSSNAHFEYPLRSYSNSVSAWKIRFSFFRMLNKIK